MSTISLLGGGLLVVYLLTMLWEFALFQRIMDDPVKGKMSSVAAGYLSASLISSILLGAGWPAFLYYIFGAVVVGTFAYSRGMKLRQMQPHDELAGTFQ